MIPTATKAMNEMVAYIRLFLRDFEGLNRLIEGQESSDRLIAWAIIDTVDDFNSTPPFLGEYQLSQLPPSLMRKGAAATLLRSAAILQARNQLSYSDGGISVTVSDKAPFYNSMANLLEQGYNQKRDKIKASLNVEQAMTGSGVLSEYFVVNGLYFSDY